MASAGHIQTLLMCAKAQKRRAMLPDGFSIDHFRLGTRLCVLGLCDHVTCDLSLLLYGGDNVKQEATFKKSNTNIVSSL